MLLGFLVCVFCVVYFTQRWVHTRKKVKSSLIPIAVNFHFTRKCNYECGFCYHTAKTSDKPTMIDAKFALRKLKDGGMRKLNFAGGEPFLYPNYLGELVRFCKQDLGLESVSIVTNGSKVKRDWFIRYAENLDIMAVSCDSFNKDTNVLIGRGKEGLHLEAVQEVSSLCREFRVKFKVNTVVCRYNWQEDMNHDISMLQPFRWKCFQVLIVPGENTGTDGTLKNATKFQISSTEFEAFTSRHEKVHGKRLVPEPNNLMRHSYLMIDEHLRFYASGKTPSERTLLDTDLQTLLKDAGWDETNFFKRGGVYDWSRNPNTTPCSNVNDKKLDW
ncbi:1527_t:CDS:1 [Funneliformis geosporum]|uniref:7150_t:CDS:1 n=1 Tax=Funneliformis geosporum TaxID=1117311 RepID=A0A9W4SL25_9GLOM|nr:1527_t:CDS:1 [Funneliformis geosporum]CAI2173912.1 7150_t:CDS:1 [Funneliformis geosporum]